MLCFSPYLFKTGFYLDDWQNLKIAAAEGHWDWTAGVRAFARSGHWGRPAQILYFPTLIYIGGAQPWVYRLILLTLHLLTVTFYFLILRRLSGSEESALLAAALAMVYPNYHAHHIWMTVSLQMSATAFAFFALWLHLLRLEKRGLGLLIAGQACYLIALLQYESVAFLPGILAVGLWIKALRTPGRRSPLRTGLQTAQTVLPFVLTFAAATLYQRVIVPALIEPSRKTMMFHLDHIPRVYLAAVECATTRILQMITQSAHFAWMEYPVYAWVLLLASSLGVAWLMIQRKERESGGAHARVMLLAVGAALFVLSYIPYIFTERYTPRLFSVANRINLGGGMAAGTIAAAVLTMVPLRKNGIPWRRIAAAGAFAAFGLCHWMVGFHWTKAWVLQKQILQDISASLPDGRANVILQGVPSVILGAPVFYSRYGITAALSLTTGRSDIQADWAGPLSGMGNEGIVVVNGNGITSHYPFKDLYVYDGESRTLLKIDGSGNAAPLKRRKAPRAGPGESAPLYTRYTRRL